MKVPYEHPAWIEIDLRQFKKNIQILRNHLNTTDSSSLKSNAITTLNKAYPPKICLPIKANAYGHGLIPIARAAAESEVDYLAVSCLQEGVLLRQADIQIPILVMGAIHESQIPQLLEHQLELTIASQFKAELVVQYCQQHKLKARVHIEIDTGMQRTGVRPSTGIALTHYLQQHECIETVGVYSHLATADEPTSAFVHEQVQQFDQFIDEAFGEKRHNIICHLANSGGICYFPETYFDMVRPGLLAFGYFPGPAPDALKSIRPFFSLKAKIAYFKVVEANTGISYSHRYKTQQKTRIVTVPVGYGDGYRRALSNRAEVLIHGKRYPIAGTICMDQFMVDIAHDEAHVGDEVTLIGEQAGSSITVDEIAQLCETIPYEIICGFTDRLPRYYTHYTSTCEHWRMQ